MKTKTLDHHAPFNGIKVKDYSWTVEMEAEVEIEMEELTAVELQDDDARRRTSAITVIITARNFGRGALRYTPPTK